MGYETTECNQCYYFMRIHRANTCQLKGGFLSDKVVGCYSGSKVRDIEKEMLYRKNTGRMQEGEYHMNRLMPASRDVCWKEPIERILEMEHKAKNLK